MFLRAGKKFFRIDGSQRSEAFAFNAFFSLFPLMVLLVTIATFFADRVTAGKETVACLESHAPITARCNAIFSMPLPV